MPHPLVLQLRFARSEFKRGLKGLTNEDAVERLLPMNCVSWSIGHLAWQEQRYWLQRGQSLILLPRLNEQFANGAPASTPALDEVWEAWNTITNAADPWLDTLATEDLSQGRTARGGTSNVLFGTLLLRTTYHYWYHTGENSAIRQMLGNTSLPDFVGDIDVEAPYRTE